MWARILFFGSIIFTSSIIKTQSVIGQNIHSSSDTVTYSYSQLEELFIKNNIPLLSQKYRIKIGEATIQQSRLYENPTLFYENVLYNPENNKWFDNSDVYGERQLLLQQLILIGGKRSQLIKMAENNKSIEEFAFYDLLRALKFQLISDYVQVYFNLEKLKLLSEQERKMQTLVASFKLQLTLGAVSAYEVTRIEFEYYSIKKDIVTLISEIAEAENRLKVLTQLNTLQFIKPLSITFNSSLNFQLGQLIDSAFYNRPDLKISENQIALNNNTLRYERANAIPNLTIGGDYDRLGNAFKNYTGINIAFDLPVFNRNQGNIKVAELEVENSKLLYEYNKLKITQEVQEAYKKFDESKTLQNSLSTEFKESINSINNEAILRYNQRVISLLDFVDKIRTYKNGRISIIEIENDFILSFYYLIFVTNTKLY